MALATQCPHCHTTFRVASDQLKLRGGIVRCGACQSIFDGSAHLIDLDALAASKDEADVAAPAAHEPESVRDADAAAAAAVAADTAAPGDEAQTAPFDSVPVFDPPASLSEASAEPDHGAPSGGESALTPSALEAAPVPESAPSASTHASHGRIEPGFGLPVDEELVAQPLPGDEHPYQDEPEHQQAAEDTSVGADGRMRASAHEIPSAALPLRASAAASDTLPPPAAPPVKSARAKAVEARTRRSRLTPTDIAAPKLRVPASAEADEPEFVKRSRKLEASGRTRRLLMIAGAVVLALLLASQLLHGFRNVLAARYPGARPVLAAGCALLGCRIGLPAQAENLAIETGELTTLGVDTYSLNTLLRNQGSLVQAWPSIQLELTDANDKPVLRRVFGPADYLPRGVAAAGGFAAHSEQPVRLNFVLTELKPSGYHIAVFYP